MIQSVYIAGPLRGDQFSDSRTQAAHEDANINDVMKVAQLLLDVHLRPHIPHFNSFLNKLRPRTLETWLEIDFYWLGRCDCMYRMPGKSQGADAEEKMAVDWGLMIYNNIERLIQSWGKCPNCKSDLTTHLTCRMCRKQWKIHNYQITSVN